MKRRTLLASLGGVTVSGIFAVGTGAFTSVSAQRNVSVSVADDDEAFLKLTQRGSGERSETDGVPEKIELQLPGDDEGDYPAGNPTDPEGLGTDSVYRFAEDAAHDEAGLFGVQNQGTQPVEVYSTQSVTGGIPSVTIFDVETGDRLTESDPSSELDTGEKLLCGLEVDTHGVAANNNGYDVSLTINAVAPQ